MFSTTGLFKSIPCPEGEKCTIINCIFSHELRPKVNEAPPAATLSQETETNVEVEDGNAPKRRKLDHDPSPSGAAETGFTNTPSSLAVKTFSTRTTHVDPLSTRTTHINPPSSRPTYVNAPAKTETQPSASTSKPLQTLKRPVSPPSTSRPSPKLASSKPITKETLNPRMIPYDPAGHAKRTLFLHHLHAQTKRLNDELSQSSHAKKTALTLTDQELITAALDEEEKLARENSKVYANVIKNRIAAYKKMKIDDWISHLLATVRLDMQEKPTHTPAPIDTGLPMDQEYLMLPLMITDQAPLANHGYVPIPPTETEIAEAQASVAASLNYETCERCNSRFRIFPERRAEDGALASNGACTYHWSKALQPKREKTDAIKGVKEAVHPCCHEQRGTKGCTQCETHVFKISEAKRLASVLPFINTPENPSPAKGPDGKPPSAVTFDCEMGFTTEGFELIRLTAVSWPEGLCLADVLVRPQGTVLDLNSRWSGVWPDAFASAIPYEDKIAMDALLPPPPPGSNNAVTDSDPTGPLPIMSSPAAARDLLCSFITPSTPLIGHALENDLNSVRLCHPNIIDTVVLYPHPRGLPIRYGLKMLTKRYLNRDIQMAGDAGHDSLEDARATGDLVRWAVGQRYKQLSRDGWAVRDGVLMPPLPPTGPPPVEERVLGAGSGVKRQRI